MESAVMTVSQCYQYCFLALICLGLFIQNYINMKYYGHQTPSGRFLLLFVLALMADCVFEIAYGLRETGLFAYNDTLGYIEEILYAIITMYAAYFWFISSELYQRSKLVATKKRWLITSIPLLIMVALTLLTPIHHLNFHFENGHYVRGPLALVFTAVLGAFIVWTGIGALIRSFRKEFYIEKKYFHIIFLYTVILLTFQAMQTVFGPIMPFRTMGAALVVYMIQQKYIKENIYADNLTGANNRNAADKYLIDHLHTNLQLAMIDIDCFKEINDTYGHPAGDRALQLMAKAFRENLGEGGFFARYGGDEFLLLSTSEKTDELEKTVEAARNALKEKCAQEGLGFEIGFSCGIVKKTPEMETIPDILAAADAEMYREKNAKKSLSGVN